MKTKTPHSFYLASGWDSQYKMHDLRSRLEDATGWTCTSRWIDTPDNYPPEKACAEDIRDLSTADILIITDGPSTKGGKWVEFGIALALSKPILIIDEGNTHNLTIFTRHMNVMPMSLENVISQMRAWSGLLDAGAMI